MNIPGRKYFPDEEVYSEWFPRTGDDLLLRFERITSSPSAALQVTFEVFSKNSETAGSGVGKGTPVALTVADDFKTMLVQSTAADGLLELVRVKATVQAGGGSNEWMLARVLPPIFFNRSATL